MALVFIALAAHTAFRKAIRISCNLEYSSNSSSTAPEASMTTPVPEPTPYPLPEEEVWIGPPGVAERGGGIINPREPYRG
jgi:hypothetical protein